MEGGDNEQSRNATFDVDLEAELRCPQCRRILLKGHMAKGSNVEIQCKCCKTKTKFLVI